MKKLFSFLLILLFTTNPLKASSANIKSPNFVPIAKESASSVVLIKTKGNQPSIPFNMGPESPIPFDHPLWKFFFGPNIPHKQQPRQGQGSGFIVSSDGYIITNAHVIKDAKDITVTSTEGNEYRGVVIGADQDTDVAVIKIEAQDLPFLTFADSDSLEVGEWVMAIGTPLGLQASITAGIVSAKGRSRLSLANYEDFIQTDASINPGNSGGPLLNLDGKVVGINTAIASHTGGYMGIGFAIPSKIAQHVFQQIVTHGSVSRGYLGVLLQPIDSNLAQSFNLDNTHGALVAEVLPESPAEAAGLKRGDVIIKLNKQSYKTMMSLRNAIAHIYPETEINLEIIRDGEPLTLTVVIGENVTTHASMNDLEKTLGITISEYGVNISPTNTESSNVMIESVQPNSDAAYLGLDKGTIILTANNKEVFTIHDFMDQFEQSKAIGRILLLVKQNNHTRYVSLDY